MSGEGRVRAALARVVALMDRWADDDDPFDASDLIDELENGIMPEARAALKPEATGADSAPRWVPEYEPWRHGGWYVGNVRYPSGAVGCVSRNYPDRKWRIVCDRRNPAPTYRSRDDAARAELALAQAERGAVWPEPAGKKGGNA